MSNLFWKKRRALAGNRKVICFSIEGEPAAASYEQWLNISIQTNCRGCQKKNNSVGNWLLPDSNPLRHKLTLVQHQTGDIIHKWSLSLDHLWQYFARLTPTQRTNKWIFSGGKKRLMRNYFQTQVHLGGSESDCSSPKKCVPWKKGGWLPYGKRFLPLNYFKNSHLPQLH